MMTVNEAFEEFRQRLELSESELADTICRHQEVRKLIRGAFDIENDFLTGSYARYTKTKPLKDVDIFFVMGEEESPRRKKPPEQTLDAFEKILVKEYGREAVEPGRRCLTVSFDKRNPTVSEEGKVLSVDVVPAFAMKQHYEIPDRILGRWIETDPEIHKEMATKKNKELDGKWVPLVKMLKRWNRSIGKPIKPSFLIEVMARDLVDAPFTTWASEVRRFFAAASLGIQQDWPDPAGYGPPVSDQMTDELRRAAVELLKKAQRQAAIAARLEEDGKQGDALRAWAEIMGKYFPCL